MYSSMKIVCSGLMVALLAFCITFDSPPSPKTILKNDTGTVPAAEQGNFTGEKTTVSPQPQQSQKAQRPIEARTQDRPVQAQRSLQSGRPGQPRQSLQNQKTIQIQKTTQPPQSRPQQPLQQTPQQTPQQPQPPKAQQPGQMPQQPKQAGATSPNISVLTQDEGEMLGLVNAERAKNGLAALTANSGLTRVARLKAKDMIGNNYFSHTSPTYGSPFDMMRQFGINYRTAGENLAGASTVNIAHTNLMNSPGHRANILGSEYKWIGIGIVDGGPYGKMFVQMFTG